MKDIVIATFAGIGVTALIAIAVLVWALKTNQMKDEPGEQ